MSKLERVHLEIIRAVHENGSITSAAEKMFLTQSALSHSIRKLENSLGMAIWERDGHSLLLTQGGAYLLSVANRLLPQLERAEEQIRQYSRGERGTLRIGMECHPCYQWLLKLAKSYLEEWPDVELDVVQKFQFGGMEALYGHDIDILVTPDPINRKGVTFEPVFDYEQVLVVGKNHKLRNAKFAKAEDLTNEILITYPVSTDRLDIYSHFLNPAGIIPRLHKRVESTDIILQMVESGRGVAALPRWLIVEQQSRFEILPVRMGSKGIPKQIHVGYRSNDQSIDFIDGFLRLARKSKKISAPNKAPIVGHRQSNK